MTHSASAVKLFSRAFNDWRTLLQEIPGVKTYKKTTLSNKSVSSNVWFCYSPKTAAERAESGLQNYTNNTVFIGNR
jgi:hypothetical protein